MPQGNQTFRNTRTEMIEEKEVCPYNRSHLIRPERMARHLLLCRKDVLSKPTHPFHHEARQMEICPLDANHHICKAEMPRHIRSCTARQQLVMANIDDGPEPEWRSCIPKGRSVVAKEDDWGEEADRNPHETYNPELKIQNSAEPILYNIQGRSKSEKKNYRSEQRLKYGTNQTASWNEEEENRPVGLPTSDNYKKKNKKKQPNTDVWANTNGWSDDWNPTNSTEHSGGWGHDGQQDSSRDDRNRDVKQASRTHSTEHNGGWGQDGLQDSSRVDRNNDVKEESRNHSIEHNGGWGQDHHQDSSRDVRNSDVKQTSRTQKNNWTDENGIGANRTSNDQNHGGHAGWKEEGGSTATNVWGEDGWKEDAGATGTNVWGDDAWNDGNEAEEAGWQRGVNEDWPHPTHGKLETGSRSPDTHGSRYSDGPWSSSRASSSSPDQPNPQSLSPLGNRRNVQLSPAGGRGRGRGRGNHTTSPMEVGNLRVTISNDRRDLQDWDNDVQVLVPRPGNNAAEVDGQFSETISFETRSTVNEPKGNNQQSIHNTAAPILDQAFVDNNSEDIFQSDEEDEYFPDQEEVLIPAARISPNESNEDRSRLPPDQVPQGVGRGASRPPPGFNFPSPEAPMLSSPDSEHQHPLAAQFQHPMLIPRPMLPIISPHQMPILPGVSPQQTPLLPGISPQQISMLPNFSPQQTPMLQGVFTQHSIWAQNWMAHQAMAQQMGHGNVLGVDGLGQRLEQVNISGQESRDAAMRGNSSPWDHQQKNSAWPLKQMDEDVARHAGVNVGSHEGVNVGSHEGVNVAKFGGANGDNNTTIDSKWSHVEDIKEFTPGNFSKGGNSTSWDRQEKNSVWPDQQPVPDQQSGTDEQSGHDQQPWPDQNTWSDQQSEPDQNPWADQSGNDQQPWSDQKSEPDRHPWSDQQSVHDQNPWSEQKSGSDQQPWFDHQSGADQQPWPDQQPVEHDFKKEEKCVVKSVWGNGEAKEDKKNKWGNIEEIKEFTPGGIPREELPLDAIPFDASDFPALG